MTGTGSHGELSVMPRTQSPGRYLPGLVMQVGLAPQPCRSQALVSAPPVPGATCSPGPAGQASVAWGLAPPGSLDTLPT